MNVNDKYIIELAKASIFDKAPAEPPAGVDWSYIFKKANEQSIVGLLCYAVKKLEKSQQPDDGLMARWDKLMLSTMGVMTQRYSELQRMSRVISGKGIHMIGLKGCIVCDLYPVPELRTMGDFDTLVRREDMDAVRQLFLEEGYQIEDDLFCIICRRQSAFWEVFTGLEEEFQHFPDEMNRIFSERYVSGAVMDYPEPTYFLAHLIVHTGKHYVREGAGIRNLCDIALLIDRYKDEIDFDEVKRICANEKFENIYHYLLCTVGTWFDVDISGIEIEEKDTEKFLEYSLAHGIFGKHDNALAIQASKHEDDSIGSFRKIFFPTAKLLDYRYTYLKKYPFLLPAAWVHRFFSAIFKRKYSVQRMTGEVKEAVQFSKERRDRLEELGLLEDDK